MARRVATLVGTSLAITLAIGGTAAQVTQAVQLPDGTVAFNQPPDLIDATTTFDSVNVWGATYYFTVNVPAGAGELLQRLVIHQREGTDNIRYKLENTRAFAGTRSNRGEKVSLGEVRREGETRTVFVNFDPPVPPGKTVTIGLRPVQNPRNAGVYLFGVTAFPAGEKSQGQFLGFGRLNFYSSGPSD